MCGILGILDRGSAVDPGHLAIMRDSMIHRGPDAGGTWLAPNKTVGLAHRRLSIIDLSTLGNQPMHARSDSLHITFNGEIYNHREIRDQLISKGYKFHSQTDTEVILHAYDAWGSGFLERLRGMFAFGLYDQDRGTLLLARDRVGEKPLYYWRKGTRFVFASELKAIMADPGFDRRIEPDSLNHYLAFGYVSPEGCMLTGVRKVPPAHLLTVDLASDRMTLERYWHVPEPSVEPEPQVDELASVLGELLRSSVRSQLVADVPVGILLSGGLDSSLVTAIAAEVSDRPIKTFTVSFPGFGSYDEASHARLIARHFGTDHNELVAEQTSVDVIRKLAAQYDEPMCDSSMVPTYLVSQLIRKHATVALGGDGGDELFGGYMQYSRILAMERTLSKLPRALRVGATALANRLPLGTRGRNYLLSLGGATKTQAALVATLFDSISRRRLLSPLAGGGPWAIRPESLKERFWNPALGLPGAPMLMDFQTYLPEDILVKVDRASMLASLEMRCPWLDHRIVEFAYGKVPNNLRACGSRRKIVPSSLGQRILPREFQFDRKQGFSLPLGAWFKGQWGEYLVDVLSEIPPTIFDRQTIRELIRGQRRGYHNTERIFSLALFELWRREYRVQAG